ncbi:hypothetical protein BUALT_Bualt02G0102000 [Buddleja alternifolia]|uniref:Uncharacterized protein n=1 Tax=Buddleja alternifolia TaxID=168488 RepID=A0AAV6Y9V6_9LAMI|nr:hypothetical protein BUALT_Bualt02G0102000 [Buddleja alternifolia]
MYPSGTRQLLYTAERRDISSKKHETLRHWLQRRTQLVAIGDKIPDNDLLLFALNGLPPDYAPFITAIENSQPCPSFREFRARLLNHEQRLISYNTVTPPLSDTALAANTAAGRGRGSGYHKENKKFHPCGPNFSDLGTRVGSGTWNGSNGNQPTKYQICYRSGHTAAKCYFRVRPPVSSTGASKSKASSSTTLVPITRKRRALLISEALPPVTDSATELPQTSIEDEEEDVDPQPLIHRSRKRLHLAETIEVPDPSVKTATLEELPLELDVEDILDTNSPTALSASGLNPETQTTLTEVITSFGTVSPASTEVPSSSLAPVPSVYHSDDMATIASLFSIPVLPSSIRLSFSSLTGISTIFVDPSILGSSPSGGLSLQSFPGPSSLPATSVHIEEIDPIPDVRVAPSLDPSPSTLATSSEFEEVPMWFDFLPKLQFLSLKNNSFTGSIPLSISNLSNLEFLDFSSNSLQGNIPEELERLKSIEVLDLQLNHLSGSIPLTLFNMSSLKSLALKSNTLSGILPSDMCHYLPFLEQIDLSMNHFSGQIPSNLLECYNFKCCPYPRTPLVGIYPEISGS